jgi:lysophospholipid hydrolase
MSLCGYLPPICDNNNLLLDGGYMNNVPADIMLEMGTDRIIAVDVGSAVDNNYDDYGDTLNGFYAIFQKFFGKKKYISLGAIQYRLAYVSSQQKMKEMMDNEKIILLRPDIDHYNTMDFNKLDEIITHGYEFGKKIVKEWRNSGSYIKYFEACGVRGKKRRYSI